ncbi:MAG: thiamine-phosphate pyrophosphorylase [Candidatus Omnitrophica bacterium]|nr:thiamine-phosphate pyrophosphorylase [Candidatus Omnitrophota bacterium]
MDERIFCIIDANVNRFREAMRVCEEITRFVLSDEVNTRCIKALRHRLAKGIKILDKGQRSIVEYRRPAEDVGRRTIKSETKRSNASDIFNANIKRAQESARVLEEFSKLFSVRAANTFKDMRFECYELEKKIVKRLRPVRNH